jgi:hypothetical protein
MVGMIGAFILVGLLWLVVDLLIAASMRERRRRVPMDNRPTPAWPLRGPSRS